jgi:hypothetical protein
MVRVQLTPIVWAVLASAPAYAASGEGLLSLFFPDAKIDAAEVVPAGTRERVPEVCRVAATLAPSADSEIKVEAWLPTSG